MSVASICTDGFGDEDFTPLIQIAPSLGVKNVELMCWHPRTITRSGVARNNKRLSDAGLEATSIHFLPFHGGDIHVTGAVAQFLWIFEVCEMLNISALKFTGTSRKVENGLDKAITVLKSVTPVAEEKGIDLMVENHFENTFEFKHDYEKIFSAIDSKRVGIALDTGHFLASGVDMIDLMETFPQKIFQIDMKDCAAGPGRRFMPFGQGDVEFDKLIGRVCELGFSGYLLVEFPRRDEANAKADTKAGIDIALRHVS
jgi:sugar phosphate isomerase/epimerase